MSGASLAYKVLSADEMAALERDGRFAGSADDQRDGYIHLSTAAQLEATLERHFAGRDGLHLAAIDLDAVEEVVRWEEARGGHRFPHLYGPLPLDAVVAYGPLEREPDGRLRMPVAG